MKVCKLKWLVGMVSVVVMFMYIHVDWCCSSTTTTLTKEVMLGEKSKALMKVERALEISTQLNESVIAMATHVNTTTASDVNLQSYTCQTVKLVNDLQALKSRIQREVIALQYGITCYGLSALDSNVCNGKGACQSTDTCLCNYGYTGFACEKSLFSYTNSSQSVANFYENVNSLIQTLTVYPEVKNQINNLTFTLNALNSKLKLFNTYESNRDLVQSVIYLSMDDVKVFKQDLSSKIASIREQLYSQNIYLNAILASIYVQSKQTQQSLTISNPNTAIPNAESYNFESVVIEPQETSINWQVSNNVLPIPIDGSFTFIHSDGYIYMLGGRGQGQLLNTILRASVNDPTVWKNAGTVGFTKGFGCLVIADGFMYAIGGFDGSYSSTVFKAPVSSFNVSTSWTQTTSLAYPAGHATHFISGDIVYIVGGYNTALGVINRIQMARLSEQLKTWTDLGAVLPDMHASCIQVLNSVVYLFGVGSGGNKIYTAFTNSPTKWNDTGVVLPISNVGPDFSLMVSGQFIYIFASNQNLAMRAPITNPIYGWKVLTSVTPTIRQCVTIVRNNMFYIIGGWTNTDSSNMILSAPIPK